MFLSLVRPERISSPITNRAAVTRPLPPCVALCAGSLMSAPSCPARCRLARLALGDQLPVEREHALRHRLAGVALLVVRSAPFDQVGPERSVASETPNRRRERCRVV